MAKEIKIPEISEGVDTATVAEILVSEGDQIEKDQAVLSVETDKATAEVPASAGGTIKETKVSEGQEVKVGDVVIILDGEDNDDSEDSEDKKESRDKNQEAQSDKEEDNDHPKKEKAKKDAKEKSAEKEDDTENKKDTANQDSSSKEVYASPGVRRLARELDIKLENVHGSGESGRITENDLREHQEGNSDQSFSKLEQLPDFSKWGATERKKLNSIKKATAKNVTASWQTIPHVFQFAEADISNIEDYIEKHQDEIKEAGGKLTVTGILTRIVALALNQFPKFNASIDMENDEMILKKYVNINIAVATDKGLLVPVIKDADQKSMKDLSLEISEIAKKAREQELSKEEMEGGNFSISNLGGIGGTNFTPIIYHPQVAILGISQATTKAVHIEGEFQARSILPLSLSYDHRLIDGADGAEFINWIVKALEDPYEALLH